MKTLLGVANLSAVLVAVGGCGFLTPPNGRVDAKSVSVRASDKGLLLGIEVDNGTDAPVFIYDAVRSVARDEVLHRTTLRLRDVPWTVTGSSADCHLSMPTYRRIEPLSVLQLDIAVPQAWVSTTGLAFPNPVERGEPPQPEQASVVHADRVQLEFAWSDVPFTTERGGAICSADLATAMIALEKGVATTSVQP